MFKILSNVSVFKVDVAFEPYGLSLEIRFLIKRIFRIETPSCSSVRLRFAPWIDLRNGIDYCISRLASNTGRRTEKQLPETPCIQRHSARRSGICSRL